MAKVYQARTKTSGRTWLYEVRRTFNRTEFRHVCFNGQWANSLSKAKELALSANKFRYNDEPPIVTIESSL